MSLPSAYMTYPMRRRGMDHDYYPYSKFPDRAPIAWRSSQWSGEKKLLIWIVVSLEYFPMVANDSPFRAPGHMQTAYPDYRHYTVRDYGSRVGIYRLLDAFKKYGVTASIATNSAIADRYPQLIDDIVAGGHEIIAHSVDMNGTIASGIGEAEERALIETSLARLEKASGRRPRGWLSIARSQSFNTARLLVEAGVDYMCDWVNDELPYYFATDAKATDAKPTDAIASDAREGRAAGGNAGDIVNIPLNHELSDRQIINVQQQSIDSYVEQMQDAAQWLLREATAHGGRMLPMHVTPYIVGLPYRMAAFERLLAGFAANADISFARGDAILDSWQAQQPQGQGQTQTQTQSASPSDAQRRSP